MRSNYLEKKIQPLNRMLKICFNDGISEKEFTNEPFRYSSSRMKVIIFASFIGFAISPVFVPYVINYIFPNKYNVTPKLCTTAGSYLFDHNKHFFPFFLCSLLVMIQAAIVAVGLCSSAAFFISNALIRFNLLGLAEKAYQYEDTKMCVRWLLNYTNVSCIMRQKNTLHHLGMHSERVIQAEPCFWSAYETFAMQQGSPYTPSFDRIIRITQESGIAEKWWQQYRGFIIDTRNKKISVNASLGLVKTNMLKNRLRDHSHRNVFFLLLTGYLLSLVFFIMELIVKHFYVKLRRRWRRLGMLKICFNDGISENEFTNEPFRYSSSRMKALIIVISGLGEKAYRTTDGLECLTWLLDFANVSCITGQNVILYLQAVHSDRVKQAKPCFWSAYLSLFMRQGSPYTPSFDRIIRITQESGIAEAWWRYHRERNIQDHNRVTSVNASLGLIEQNILKDRLRDNSYRSVFFLLLAGYLLSFVVFIMELIVKHFYVKLRRRWRRLGCLHFLPIEPLIGQISARQVLLLNHDSHQKPQRSQLSEEMENWIYSRFSNQLPCTWTNIDKNHVPVLLKKSNSLFLYVGTEDEVDSSFINKLKDLTLNFAVPYRVLLMMFDRKNDSSSRYQNLLEQFWEDQQLLDVTIIGISSRISKSQRKIAITAREMDYAATIHHYNPFTSIYTNRALNASSRLFPAKLDDLHGYRLGVQVTDNGSFSQASQESLKIERFLGMLLEMIQSKLNFSVELHFISSDDIWRLNGSIKTLLEDEVDSSFIKKLKDLTFNFVVPFRVLLIMFNRKNDSSVRYQNLFEQFWEEQLLDVTIIGISSRISKSQRKIAIIAREMDYAATIHHYNPFTSIYTNRALNASSRLFPAKLDDLHGYRLGIQFTQYWPFSLASQESLKIEGFVGILLEMIQSKMNFRVEPHFRSSDDFRRAGVPDAARALAPDAARDNRRRAVRLLRARLHRGTARDPRRDRLLAHHPAQLAPGLLPVPVADPVSRLLIHERLDKVEEAREIQTVRRRGKKKNTYIYKHVGARMSEYAAGDRSLARRRLYSIVITSYIFIFPLAI
ncbi:unnamed protein product [Trichogramma brassicae]|uniref:Ionotropic glutamate receptor L-glutamate and glycine-binding domain-containing protein n=1 Tax=Trichogramma brassicae TaxID=86971 RepID=A0A6H5I2J0_9HYME|nr:unnamed protein product [Trichogramma brassicae]